MAWSQEQIDTLKKLRSEGLSPGRIGDRMGRTRNAVIGKLHRLGMCERARPAVKMAKLPRRPEPKKPFILRPLAKQAKPLPPLPLPAQPVSDVARVAFMDLENHMCRWPVGDPVQGFCGCDKVPGLSYCAGHAARAFANPMPIRPSTWRQGSDPLLTPAAQEFLAEAVA